MHSDETSTAAQTTVCVGAEVFGRAIRTQKCMQGTYMYTYYSAANGMRTTVYIHGDHDPLTIDSIHPPHSGFHHHLMHHCSLCLPPRLALNTQPSLSRPAGPLGRAQDLVAQEWPVSVLTHSVPS